MDFPINITTNSEQETIEFGIQLSGQLKPGQVLTFSGNLGSGKTTLIRGICRGLKVQEAITSPTFTLINEYNGTIPVYHFDFYRLHSSLEAAELGLEEYFFGQGVCLIEWPDIIQELLPKSVYQVKLLALFEKGLQDSRNISINKTDN